MIPFKHRRFVNAWWKPLLLVGVITTLLVVLIQMPVSAPRRKSSTSVCVILVTSESDFTGSTTPYVHQVIENRIEYVRAHDDYRLFFANTSAFSNGGANEAWAKLPAIQEAMRTYPEIDYFWYLEKDAIIMNPSIDLYSHLLDEKKLNRLLLRDRPIIPPDSAIHTLRSQDAKNVELILTQDHQGITPNSLILRRGKYASFLLQIWNDPMYRFYPFSRMEQQALEHIVQWHYYVLNRVGIVPSRLINAYPHGADDLLYKEGDFVVSLVGCRSPERSCEKEFEYGNYTLRIYVNWYSRYWHSRGRALFDDDGDLLEQS